MLKGADAKIEIPVDFTKDKKQTELQKKKLKSIKRRGLIFDKGGALSINTKRISSKNNARN